MSDCGKYCPHSCADRGTAPIPQEGKREKVRDGARMGLIRWKLNAGF